MYNNNLHILVWNTAHCTALVLISYILIHCICQKYLPLEHDFESEEVHFSLLVEGVKHHPTPHILLFFFENSLKSTDFCLFWFLFWVGKDNLHYSDRLRFLLRFFSGLKIHNSSICTVEITQYALKGQKLIAQGIALGNYERKPIAL